MQNRATKGPHRRILFGPWNLLQKLGLGPFQRATKNPPYRVKTWTICEDSAQKPPTEVLQKTFYGVMVSPVLSFGVLSRNFSPSKGADNNSPELFHQEPFYISRVSSQTHFQKSECNILNVFISILMIISASWFLHVDLSKSNLSEYIRT